MAKIVRKNDRPNHKHGLVLKIGINSSMLIDINISPFVYFTQYDAVQVSLWFPEPATSETSAITYYGDTSYRAS